MPPTHCDITMGVYCDVIKTIVLHHISWMGLSHLHLQNNILYIANLNKTTHLLGFVFMLRCFYENISIKIVYFYLKYYELFLCCKSSSSLITASKMFYITAPWCHTKHPLSYHNGLGDIVWTTKITMGKWHCRWYQTIMWPTAWIFHTESRKI